MTCELPDEITAAALLNIDATGKVDIEMILLLTPEQLDEAAHKTVHYKVLVNRLWSDPVYLIQSGDIRC